MISNKHKSGVIINDFNERCFYFYLLMYKIEICFSFDVYRVLISIEIAFYFHFNLVSVYDFIVVHKKGSFFINKLLRFILWMDFIQALNCMLAKGTIVFYCNLFVEITNEKLF